MLPPVQDELQLTKKRIQNLRVRRLGLQQLAVRVISKQLTFYRTHPDELEKLKSLPGVLREQILQLLMKKRCLDNHGEEMEFENLKEIFPLLLSPRTRYIELSGILSFCPDWFNEDQIGKVTECCVELFKQIETRAPQVETLIIKRNNPYYAKNYYCLIPAVRFNQEMVQSVMKMQTLNRITVSLYCFHLSDVLKICKSLSRLEYIDVELINSWGKDRPAHEELFSSFCNLKEFIYERRTFDNDWMGGLCTRNLANIQVLQFDPNEIAEWISGGINSNRYHSLDFPGFSNLRNICVDQYSAVEELPNLFPKVTCLKVRNIENSSTAENVMPKFDNIRQLHLLNSSGSDVIEKYLMNYGQKLQSLDLGHDRALITIDLELIFNNCPKVEKLSLLNVCLKPPESKIEFFAELKELVWADDFYDYNRAGVIPDQEGKDFSILSAPKLEKVKLQARIFNKNDLLTLNSLIREKRILKNLNTLHVYYPSPVGEALANVLKSACAFLPKLTDFKFGKKLKCEDLPPERKSTPISDIDACISEMISVFQNEN